MSLLMYFKSAKSREGVLPNPDGALASQLPHQLFLLSTGKSKQSWSSQLAQQMGPNGVNMTTTLQRTR